ncbi:serine hydrolase domain-containing protein [uncultured Enterovirga sp.]|uniref:serine hydrolase domain-containing protein n=1 Tax=uncultured Enterovirga sp. TaxID=2026352 RepID=UPI0035CB05E8
MIPDAAAISDTLALARPEDVGMSRERLGRIGLRLEADIARGILPGAVALVARRGRVVLFKAYGRRDPQGDGPMQLDTLFRIYSMTKPIVSVALMMLVEEGRLTLADPLSAHIPAFSEMVVATASGDTVPASRPITIHDLLRHTSGLTYEWLVPGPVTDAYLAAGAGRRTQTNAEQAAVLARLPLLAHPGLSWDYSRSTDVIGRVIEIVSGQTLGAYLAERLFAPLGMMETGFHVPPDYHGRIAEPFPVDPDSGEPVQVLDVTRPPPLENGGGGLVSTAADYARFLHMIASGGTLDGARILSANTLRFMMADHLAPDVRSGSALLPEGYGFGLGFAVRRAAGHAPFPGSAGDAYWLGLAGTNFWYDPAEQLYAILMVQAPGRRDYCRDTFRSLVYGAVAE